MNNIQLTGKVLRNAIVKSFQSNEIILTLETLLWDKIKRIKRVSIVQCLIYNVRPEMEHYLIAKGKGKTISCSGHVDRSIHHVNGERKFQTDAIIDPDTIEIINK